MGDLNLNPFLILNLEVRLPAAKFLTTTSSGIIFAFFIRQLSIDKVNQLRAAANLKSLTAHIINNGEMVQDKKIGDNFKPTDTVSSSSGRVEHICGTIRNLSTTVN